MSACGLLPISQRSATGFPSNGCCVSARRELSSRWVTHEIRSALMHELMTPTCKRCQDTGWVYESHLGRPRSTELPHGFEFVVPCPDCRAHVSQSIRRIKYNNQSIPVPASEPMRKTSPRNR